MTDILDDNWRLVWLEFSLENINSVLREQIKGTWLRLFYANKNQNWIFINQTEELKHHEQLQYHQNIQIEFIFETKQTLELELYNEHRKIIQSKIQFDLGDIMGALYNQKQFSFYDQQQNQLCSCWIRLEQQEETLDKIQTSFQLRVIDIESNCFCFQKEVFIQIYKLRNFIEQNDDQQNRQYQLIPKEQWSLAYQTESKKGSSVLFKLVQITGQKLCNNNLYCPLWFQLHEKTSSFKTKVLASGYFKLKDIQNTKEEIKLYKDIQRSQQIATQLYIESFNKQNYFEFLDYIKGGISICPIVSIDFTASNRDPLDLYSLHYFQPDRLNLYQKAILSLGEVLQKFNHNNLMPAYGFGAKIPYQNQVSHFFPLSLDYDNPFYSDFGQLFQAYESILKNIQFSGPTFFAPLIEKVLKYCETLFAWNPFNYCILIILTDGQINDMQQTIDQIIKACYLPLSIIIVGIGEENFSNMDILDADDSPLVNSFGERMFRDIVQFVPFTRYQNNPFVLWEQILKEIPRQVEQFYAYKKIPPLKLK